MAILENAQRWLDLIQRRNLNPLWTPDNFLIRQPSVVTREAREQLLQWGLTEQQIQFLDYTVGRLAPGYLHCLEKVKAIPCIYYFCDEFAGNMVALPSYFYHGGDASIIGGECGLLNRFLTLELNIRGFMESLRANSITADIHLATLRGESNRFFCCKRKRHVWSGLVRYEQEQENRLIDFWGMVHLDASFGKIETYLQSGYRFFDDYQNRVDLKAVSFSSYQRLHIVSLPENWRNNRELTKQLRGEAVLGLSADGQLAYSLGFFNTNTKIHPYIFASAANGQDEAVFWLDHSSNGALASLASSLPPSLSSGNHQEITFMLDHLESVPRRMVNSDEVKRFSSSMTISW